MAFKHGQHGTITNRGVVWICPTCGTENAGPLEAGCQRCKAGADARKAAETSEPVGEAELLDDAFAEWSSTLKDIPGMTQRDLARQAFEAGAFWQRQQLDTVVRVATATQPTTHSPEGGYLLALVHPSSHEPTLTDQRTHDTILEALAFYRDNQLAFGALPGRLSAEEVTALIQQLSQPEAEESK